MESRNPFRFGALALDETFTNRRDEIRGLRADILNGQDVVLLGPRRYGKSSLVLKVVAELTRPKVLTAYCDLSTTPTRERFAEKLAQAVHEGIASPLFRARERALEAFRGLRITPVVTVDPGGTTVSFRFEAGYAPPDLDATIEGLLALPGTLGRERGRTAALVLDEFQEVTAIDPNLPRLMRAVFQRQPEVAHVYLGSKRHLMETIFNDRNEPFWRSAKSMEIGPIARRQFAAFVRARFAASERAIDRSAVERILDLTGGHPYATQQLAYFVWEEVPERAQAGLAHVERGLERLLDSEHNHFSLVWEDSTRTERLLLVAMAESPGPPFSEGFRREHRLPSATHVQKALVRLGRRELLARTGRGRYAFSEPFLRDWLLRTQR